MSHKTVIAQHICAWLMAYKYQIMWQQLLVIIIGEQGFGANPATTILTYGNDGFQTAIEQAFIKQDQRSTAPTLVSVIPSVNQSNET